MKYGNYSNVFGVEKEYGKLNGILAAIYQYVFGTELYPSIEEKAANLLYFLIKEHLIIDGKQIISDSALVAITLMIASLDQKKRKRWSNLS